MSIKEEHLAVSETLEMELEKSVLAQDINHPPEPPVMGTNLSQLISEHEQISKYSAFEFVKSFQNEQKKLQSKSLQNDHDDKFLHESSGLEREGQDDNISYCTDNTMIYQDILMDDNIHNCNKLNVATISKRHFSRESYEFNWL